MYKSAITGDIGTSPITGAALLVSCAEVTGIIYTVDAAGPLPCSVTDATKLTTAIGDMENAFTTANDIDSPSPNTEIYAGNISGQIIKPGLYKWGTNVLISNAGVTLTGGANDVIIFQIAQNLIVNNNAFITLLGGIQAKNIFWARDRSSTAHVATGAAQTRRHCAVGPLGGPPLGVRVGNRREDGSPPG